MSKRTDQWVETPDEPWLPHGHIAWKLKPVPGNKRLTSLITLNIHLLQPSWYQSVDHILSFNDINSALLFLGLQSYLFTHYIFIQYTSIPRAFLAWPIPPLWRLQHLCWGFYMGTPPQGVIAWDIVATCVTIPAFLQWVKMHWPPLMCQLFFVLQRDLSLWWTTTGQTFSIRQIIKHKTT